MIEVLFFAELQEEIGNNKIWMEAAGMTIADLKKRCLDRYKLTQLDHAMIALNEEYATDDMLLANGDTVAFIPPVSGG
ncbi:molybdopterin converting factor subunit 1 [Virgibacillus halophilus]